MKQIAYLLILNLALVIGVAAQKTVTKPFNSGKSLINKLASGEPLIFSFSGVQNSTAEYDQQNARFRGNSFVLNGGLDQFTTHLNVAADYVPDGTDTYKSIIVGGKWSLVVYDSNVYVGVIFGDITQGEILWTDNNGTIVSQQTDAQLRILGGTDEFGDLTPEVTTRPLSIFTHLEKASMPTSGALTF